MSRSEQPAGSAPAGPPTLSAGSLLREARKAQGLHLAALAAAIKVAPAKLEALENDRYDQLHDVAFTRALAQAVCRVLKIDPQPVLARLPQGASHRLERLEGGLNQPFRGAAGAGSFSAADDGASWLSSPAVWGSALLVLGALALWLLPFDLTRRNGADAAKAPSGEASSPRAGSPSALAASAGIAPPPAPVVQAPAPVEAAPAEAPSASSAPAEGESLLVLRARQDTWVEVRDAQGQVLISRTLRAGESASFERPPTPLKVRIGNAKGTQLSFRGEAIDPSATTKDNIARLELK